MHLVYLSPHLDDAALCAGGLIYDQYLAGDDVQIWTVMSGTPRGGQLTPYARIMHARWSTGTAEQTVALRRAEDRRAAAILRATPVHLGFLDAIYRTTDGGEPLYGDPVGAPVHPQDAALVAEIAQDLRGRLRGDELLVTLLGIGDHADHVIVRQAAEATGLALRYVADFPYLIRYPESIEPKVRGMRSEVLRVSESGVAAWIEAVEAYASQLEAVFGEDTARDLIIRHWEVDEGVRLWDSSSESPTS